MVEKVTANIGFEKKIWDAACVLIIITHNSALTAMADRVIQVKNGMVVSEVINEHPISVEEIEW